VSAGCIAIPTRPTSSTESAEPALRILRSNLCQIGAGMTRDEAAAAERARDKSICVYCASSRACDPAYHDVARQLGGILARQGYSIIYGGGAVGSMGSLADGAIAQGGKVVGVLPRFMKDLEWGHQGLTELRTVEDIRVRKHTMLSESQGVVALPGGSGTLEELLETVTLKRLGLYTHAIVMVNTRNFFDPVVQLLQHAVAERFMDERHLQMWQVVATPEEVPPALENAPAWSAAARQFAAIK
jgi:uncharacterized protein (TIGR00730 family)